MAHMFSQVPKAQIQRSVFDRSHTHKTAFNAGLLVPCFCEEVLPGDSWKVESNFFVRMASPLTVPIMDDMFLDAQFFFVPARLVWDNWQRFNGEQVNPGDSTDYLVPQVTANYTSDKWYSDTPNGGFRFGSVADYFGIPPDVNGLAVSALPFRCYNLIWNEWYRDENLQDSVPVWRDDTGVALEASLYKSDGTKAKISVTESDYWKASNISFGKSANSNISAGVVDAAYLQTLLPRGKRHDYFTSALPWPQKGPGVELPLGAVAPVSIYNTLGTTVGDFGSASQWVRYATAGFETTNQDSTGYLGYNDNGSPVWTMIRSSINKKWGDDSAFVLGADLSQATAATINSLRQAFQLQRLYERDARGGTRYTEIIRAHFGVVSPDARLQRPEYLGGFSTPINVNPVAQTNSTDNTTPQANLAAYAVTATSGKQWSKSFTEHGFIIGLCSVRANLTYQQGLNRMWSRRSRFDYYWPALAHLGEQAILNKEIFAQGTSADDDVFGYQERYAEYRYAPNKISGIMRSTYATPLDYWHLSQKFDSLPELSDKFIRENPPLERVEAVPSEPDFLADMYFKVRTARPMPVYGVPGLIDHF